MPHDSELMSATEVATYLRRSIGTIYNWRLRNEGPPSYRIRGKVMFRREEIERWIAKEQAGTLRGEPGT